MTMMLPEAEGAATAAVSGGEGAASKTGSKLGLTNSQKGAALGRSLPQPRTHHPYIVGLSLIVIGMFSLVGSITGTLPSMLAALFVPTALEDGSGNPAAPSLLNKLGGVASVVANPLTTLIP